MLNIFRFILYRKLFKGQFKLFLWLYNRKWLKKISTVTSPIIGNFKVNINTKNYIEACIYYTGDYEAYLKDHFKKLIKQGDIVLDIGANIGFHSLYFAELAGVNGLVLAFEPIEVNFSALQQNTTLNNFRQITIVNKALGNENSQMNIHIDNYTQNPGAFNLMEAGIKNTIVECIRGDDYLIANHIQKIDFIKVDVEGFELEVIKGLSESIQKFKPIIVFEYDQDYQSKLNINPKEIFNLLTDFSYQFFVIDGYGNKKTFNTSDNIMGSEILAIPIKSLITN
ncbi:FkbM family methyltransferase [Pedobacter mucosus]|uniref:FkbM family methyltransferase n=1 Tax=Pedobacter mucosus TaxID=2895286 RepID=UPI001EE4BE83|nr:FkbM family methyltransferase [Pedobacter mucosus]UKT64383.1 FkbM family methyltransferase [Pedobacter mucosus]